MNFCSRAIVTGMQVVRAISLLFAVVFLVASTAFAAPDLHEGDLLFQTSKSSQSIAVQNATKSAYSHMGVLLNSGGSLCVFEAVATVRCTPIVKWISRGENGHYVQKRLKSAISLASPENLAKFRAAAKAFAGLPYDLTFEWSDSRMYCSELVWKIYDRAVGIQIGSLAKLGDFDLTSAAVTKKLEERYHGTPPLDEAVISPEAMFNSPILVEISRQ